MKFIKDGKTWTVRSKTGAVMTDEEYRLLFEELREDENMGLLEIDHAVYAWLGEEPLL